MRQIFGPDLVGLHAELYPLRSRQDHRSQRDVKRELTLSRGNESNGTIPVKAPTTYPLKIDKVVVPPPNRGRGGGMVRDGSSRAASCPLLARKD